MDVVQIWCCCGCAVGLQVQLRFDLLVWELPYATGITLKRKKKKKKNKILVEEETLGKNDFECYKNLKELKFNFMNRNCLALCS